MHPLEAEFGLSATEILDALQRRFRAKVTLEGAVAEVQLARHLERLVYQGTILGYEMHDADGMYDCSLFLSGRASPLRVECKNVRDSEEAFRQQGIVVAYKVETQKTRASKSDPSSRFYGADQFDILAVCLGKKTRNWKQFLFVPVSALARHRQYPGKLAVIHRVPLPDAPNLGPWYASLGDLLRSESW